MTPTDIEDCKDQIAHCRQLLGPAPQAGKQAAGAAPTAFNPVVIFQIISTLLPVIEQILADLRPSGGPAPSPKAAKP